MERRAEEASEDFLEDLASSVEKKVESEIRRRLGKKTQYMATVRVARSGSGIDLGIDLQVFSQAPVKREDLLRIVEEVIDSGFSEAEERIKRSRERAGRGLEDKKDSGGVTPIGRS